MYTILKWENASKIDLKNKVNPIKLKIMLEFGCELKKMHNMMLKHSWQYKGFTKNLFKLHDLLKPDLLFPGKSIYPFIILL